MGRVQATRMIFNDRPLLGQMAIATVLVGGAAALSSAGIAVPVSQVDYAKGRDQRAPSATTPAPGLAGMAAPASLPARAGSVTLAAISAPRINAPASRPVLNLAESAAPMSRPVLDLAESVAPMSRPILDLAEFAAPLPWVDAAFSPLPALVSAAPVAGLAQPAPLAAPVTELVVPPLPIATPVAAPASLAASAALAIPAAVPREDQAGSTPAAVPFRLVNPPELRGFDLGRMSALPKSVPAGFAKAPAKSPVSGKVEGLGKKDTVVGDAVFHQVSVTVAGSDAKAIDVRIGADLKPSIKVGDLLGLVSDRMDPDSAVRFAAASSAGDYVSLATLRAAGFDVTYNAGADRISISLAE
jgi:hypothetical protein